ncbi:MULTISPECIES: NAD(P)H-dependent oxidoreductase [Marinilactibacillus]|uniref:Putative NADPH-quinone reductase (Modulator of drug activity B) n=1 Tax=Marinilactibacillus piezotolerans TaxID=258723 RepID=A0A1I3YT71_9LACT|nr:MULTISPECIES: NAD(P)H-dependent oxidoreductase [Marinilactibacillus]API87979.1 NAD(P)H dehydrogenase [Marinilactibacillus sp. 15R]SFK34960.1 Putative NADPH-quinone reductase (modulator of drug activity B) [Marinilactibacillus piezotolerans]
MKTLVIISHPNINESSSQQFLIQSFPQSEKITMHHLEGTYPDGQIDVKREQALLKEYDRILFQFPFYWYSSPPLLKHWFDEVLEEHFAFGYRGNKLHGKEFGLILVVGVGEKEYQTGGQEGFSISELTKPYQAIAKKIGMQYLKPLTIFQFPYMKEAQKMQLLIKYQQWVMMEKPDSLKAREVWIVNQLEETSHDTLDADESSFILDQAIEIIEDNRIELDELRMHIDNNDQ